MKIHHWQKVLSVLSVFLLLALPVTAAEEKKIAVQLNGKPLCLTDSAPMLVEGRVFVPFRAVFEGLEAEVSYDAEKNQITASRGDRRVIMTIGNPSIKLHLNGVEALVNTDAPSFIQNGRTYVPVRFAAQALDCKVGWDQTRQVVIILDMGKIEAEKASYQLMTKLENYRENSSNSNRALSGSISLKTADLENNDENVRISLTGINNSQRASLQMKVEPDTMFLAHKLLREYGHLSKEGERLLQTLEKVDVDLIIDWQTNKVYAKSELVAILGDGKAGVWYQVDAEYYLALFKQGGQVSKLVENLLLNLSLTDSVATAAALDNLEMLRAVYSDKAFAKQGNRYISKFAEKENDAELEITTALFAEGERINGYQTQMSVTENDLCWQYDLQENADALNLEMNLAAGKKSAEVKGKIEYQTTRQNPGEIPIEFVRID